MRVIVSLQTRDWSNDNGGEYRIVMHSLSVDLRTSEIVDAVVLTDARTGEHILSVPVQP